MTTANDCPHCRPTFPTLADYRQAQDVTITEDGTRYCMVCDHEWQPTTTSDQWHALLTLTLALLTVLMFAGSC